MTDLHDRLLKEMLGTPTGTWPPGQKLSPETTPLSRPWTWQFPWGRVLSTHDSKGGGTFFRVEYGDRAEQAMRRFRTL